MFSNPHKTVTEDESDAYSLLAVIMALLVVMALLLITIFMNLGLPKEWFFGLL